MLAKDSARRKSFGEKEALPVAMQRNSRTYPNAKSRESNVV